MEVASAGGSGSEDVAAGEARGVPLGPRRRASSPAGPMSHRLNRRSMRTMESVLVSRSRPVVVYICTTE